MTYTGPFGRPSPQDNDRSIDLESKEISDKNEKLHTILNNLLEIAIIHEVQFLMKVMHHRVDDDEDIDTYQKSIFAMLHSTTEEPIELQGLLQSIF